MNTYQKNARIVGVLFIIGTVAGILSNVFLGPFLNDPAYLLSSLAANRNKIVIGSLLVLTMGLSLSIMPVFLYPIFKKYNEPLALGAVVFRGVLEAVIYIMQALLMLLLIPLSQEFIAADSVSISVYQHLGAFFMSADAWFGYILSIVFSLGALMIYYVFYQSRLIPRWLSVWGLIGGLLYFAYPMLGMFGTDFGLLMLPLAVQEMVMALWLIIKGFNSEAVAS
ncbi:MAG TPA: DUF4386 domain-containing protein [Anaerolineales bacterium]|nr:DUF4386 domain-containing protein [Anaerolineales bacterium]